MGFRGRVLHFGKIAPKKRRQYHHNHEEVIGFRFWSLWLNFAWDSPSKDIFMYACRIEPQVYIYTSGNYFQQRMGEVGTGGDRFGDICAVIAKTHYHPSLEPAFSLCEN